MLRKAIAPVLISLGWAVILVSVAEVKGTFNKECFEICLMLYSAIVGGLLVLWGMDVFEKLRWRYIERSLPRRSDNNA
jgi:hypothetical protein